MNDGGLAACGAVHPAYPDTGGQDVWVLKIDSNGCEVSSCVVSAVGEIISSDEDINLRNYPNPFNSSTTIETFVSENVKTAYVSIYDYLGKEIMHFKL